MFRKTKQIHFVGIGGAGMNGIAEILLSMGYKVTGSDASESSVTRRLRDLGATVKIGHSIDNLGDADVVVYTSAARKDNPEILAAMARPIPVIKRAEMLAELMRMKYAIAVAGAHGKTTTTSLISEILISGGFDPTIVIGGKLNRLGSGARLGTGDYLVAEADESDGSFLNLYSTIAVVTNIDKEHLDHYGNFENLKKAFIEFINKAPFYGASILLLDDPHIKEILPRVNKRYLTYGIYSDANLVAKDIRYGGFDSSFTLYLFGKKIGVVKLSMPGIHNVYNSLAALTVGYELGVDFSVSIKALEEFKGLQRRVELKAEIDGVMIVDDYGHHPSEIRSTLSAIKKGFPDRRLVVAFQPHRYSRTRDNMAEFGESFDDADYLFITDIYAAQEYPIEGVTALELSRRIRKRDGFEVKFISSLDDVLDEMAKIAKPGDILLTLGAGSITSLSDRLVLVLSKDS